LLKAKSIVMLIFIFSIYKNFFVYKNLTIKFRIQNFIDERDERDERDESRK